MQSRDEQKFVLLVIGYSPGSFTENAQWVPQHLLSLFSSQADTSHVLFATFPFHPDLSCDAAHPPFAPTFPGLEPREVKALEIVLRDMITLCAAGRVRTEMNVYS